MVLILIQLVLLFLTAWGWGFWLWKISRAGYHTGGRRYAWFFFGLGGFMACVLFLHGLIYLDLPLKFTAWPAFLVALAGVATCLWGWWRRGVRVRLGWWREPVAAGALFAAVFGLQGAPLISLGPNHYYGSAHIDQVNYVLFGEFLTQEPFSTTLPDIGLRPWLAKAIALKEVRKGQSVANGYLGVVTLVDTKRAYGTLSISMVGVGALAVFVLARSLAVPRSIAWVTGFWWGVLPAVTKLHLDGFLSQACILCVFPALAALFRVRRSRLDRSLVLLSTVYLAYLLCTYTEVYVLGLGLLLCLVLFTVPAGTPWWLRAAVIGSATAGSFLLTGPYLRNSIRYIAGQYAGADSPDLAALTPAGATWVGWKQVFFGYVALEDSRLERLAILVGIALLFLMVYAFQNGGLARRRFLLMMTAPAVGVLVLLLSAPAVPKYPFSKLVDTFTPFWLVMVVLGALSWRGHLAGRWLVWLTSVALVLVALGGSWPQWRATWEDRGVLENVDSPAARRCYAYTLRHPQATYVINESHIFCAWLAYAARRSRAYMAVDQLTDIAVPTELYAFRASPPSSPDLVILNGKGPVVTKDNPGLPALVVNNPQGIEGAPDRSYYWIGPDATLTLTDYLLPAGQTRLVTLGFEVVAGPANPAHERQVALVGPDGSEQRVDFTDSTTGRFQLKIHSGDNVYRFKVLHPTQQTYWVPGDPRDHMVRLQGLSLGPGDGPELP